MNNPARFSYWAIPALMICLGASCRTKQKNPDEEFFPVLSFLQSQVSMVDTSLYPIMKITPIDSSRSDTLHVHRDQFRATAFEFLEIPDLADEAYSDRFKETRQFDEGLNRVILSYTPVNPEKEQVQNQQVTITPSGDGDKVSTIYITLVNNSKDSSVYKRLLWKADQSFQVVSTKQYPGGPEINSSYKVTWNEFDYK